MQAKSGALMEELDEQLRKLQQGEAADDHTVDRLEVFDVRCPCRFYCSLFFLNVETRSFPRVCETIQDVYYHRARILQGAFPQRYR